MTSPRKERQALRDVKRVVVKIGSSLLTNDGRGLDGRAIGSWVDQLVGLLARGIEPIVVSSGAVAEGMVRLGWHERPTELHELQAAASVGQSGLVQCWESHFSRHGIRSAQVLLTHDDLSSRRRYLNARNSLHTLTDMGVIPIINENDAISIKEIKLGDNDTLGALVANLMDADALILLTDQNGLYDADPRKNPKAKLIEEALADDERLDAVAGDGGKLGTGGMATKLNAARLAARSGAMTVIASGREMNIIPRLLDGEKLGTLLKSADEPLTARKRWIMGQMQSRGTLVLDDGAVRHVCDNGASLLPVGVKALRGRFQKGDLVTCVDQQGRKIAKGLINFDRLEADRILGVSTEHIEERVGHEVDYHGELIHRDDLVLI